MTRPTIVLQSDFTFLEGAVASMHGVIKSVSKDIEIYDATHEIPKFDIWSASFRLLQYVRFWPKDTVFVSVVDPTVGTSRRASLAITTDGYRILSPDNGSLHHIKTVYGISNIYAIDINKHRLRGYDTEEVSIFHGRDVFAYVAALVATGKVKEEEVGPRYSANEIIVFPEKDPYIEDGVVHGYFEIIDPNFGNLWTNIPVELFWQAGFELSMKLAVEVTYKKTPVLTRSIAFEKSFGFVEQHELVIYNNEQNKIAVAVSRGSLAQEYSLNYGPDWEISFRKE